MKALLFRWFLVWGSQSGVLEGKVKDEKTETGGEPIEDPGLEALQHFIIIMENPETPTRIGSIEELEAFHKSASCKRIAVFLLKLVASVEDVALSQTKWSPRLEGFQKALGLLSELVDETPAIETTRRYGNKAFKVWYDKMVASKDKLGAMVLGNQAEEKYPVWEEAFTYWSESFGSRENISYGSGHELNFMLGLLVLERGGFL